jgi:hypothetical protein
MRTEEYKSWVKKFLTKTSLQSKNLFFETVNMADNLKLTKITLDHHIESSFNSADMLSLIKVVNIFRYPEFSGQKNCKDLINYKYVLNLVKKINKTFKVNFNIKALNYIFSIPLSSGRKNDGIVFSFDLNLLSNQFSKISLHINPSEISQVIKITQFLKIKKINKIYLNLKNLEFVGFDFYSDGKMLIKPYQEIQSLPINLNKEEREMFYQIDKLRKKKIYLIMSKFDNSLPLLEKNIYIDWRGLNYMDFFKLTASSTLKSYRPFLERIKPYIIKFQIIFVAFKKEKIEIYFK